MRLYLYDAIQKPILTEKANNLENLGKYIFVVSPGSSKPVIKKAVQQIFNVSVQSVNIVNIRAKTKVFKGVKGQRSSFKKAIVTIKGTKKIEFSKGI